MFKITTTLLFCASLLVAQENLSLTQKLQQIDKEEEKLLSSFNQVKAKSESQVLEGSQVENRILLAQNTMKNENDAKRFEQVASDLEAVQKEVVEEKASEETAMDKQRAHQEKMAALFLAEKKKYDEKELQIAHEAALDNKREHQKKMAAQFLVEKKKYDDKEANEAQAVAGEDYVVTAKILNVRSKPSKNAKRVATVHKNQKVKIVKKNNSWFYISNKGWVYSKYLKKF